MNTCVKKVQEDGRDVNFRDGEHLWFWFMSGRHSQNKFHRQTQLGNRPCELVDVETMVTKLYLCGQLSSKQLIVMKDWGTRRRIPNQYVYVEHTAARVWRDAMEIITREAIKRGWIKTN